LSYTTTLQHFAPSVSAAAAAGQHIALHEPPKANHIGLICTKCSPWQVRDSSSSSSADCCTLKVFGSELGGDFALLPAKMLHLMFITSLQLRV
jgi:hypothetical protein